MGLFEVASVNRIVIESALKSKFTDFKDSILHESARHAGVNYIISKILRILKNQKFQYSLQQNF